MLMQTVSGYCKSINRVIAKQDYQAISLMPWMIKFLFLISTDENIWVLVLHANLSQKQIGLI